MVFDWVLALLLTMSKENIIHIDREKQLELRRQKTQPPPMYKVMLNNDDYTPMDFVTEVLQKFFSMDTEKANQTMLTVHYHGKQFVAYILQRLQKLK